MLASYFFRHLITVGTLIVIDAVGKTHRFAGSAGPKVTLRLHDKTLHHRLLLNPYLAAGEGYMVSCHCVSHDSVLLSETGSDFR